MRKIVDEVLTLPKLQAYIKVGFYTAKKLLETGEIPGKKINREWRCTKKAVDEWLNSGNSKAV